MAQEIKLMVRPGIGSHTPAIAVEQEIAKLSVEGGWTVRDVFHLGMEKNGDHNVMFVLVRNVGEPVMQVSVSGSDVEEVVKHRGRPAKTS
jgi:hypothetical protein